MITDISLTEAEKNELAIIDLCKGIFVDCLELGKLLLENYDQAYWSANRHESFQEFVAMLGISYSYATRYMGVAKLVASQLLTAAELYEIGMSKAALLLPCARKGKLDEDIKLLARDATFVDLRKHLGHNIQDEESEEYLLCPRCGTDISFHKGMVRRR